MTTRTKAPIVPQRRPTLPIRRRVPRIGRGTEPPRDYWGVTPSATGLGSPRKSARMVFSTAAVNVCLSLA